MSITLREKDVIFFCPDCAYTFVINPPGWNPYDSYCKHAWWCATCQRVSLKHHRCGHHPLHNRVQDAIAALIQWRTQLPDVSTQDLIDDEYEEFLEELAQGQLYHIEGDLPCIVAYDWSLAKRQYGLEDRILDLSMNCVQYIASALLQYLYDELEAETLLKSTL